MPGPFFAETAGDKGCPVRGREGRRKGGFIKMGKFDGISFRAQERL